MSSEGVLRYGTFCLVLIGIGALAYTGLWRWWSKGPFTIPLGIGWLGVGQSIANIGNLFHGALFDAFFIPGALVSAFGLYAFLFTPRPLLPRWYRLDRGIDPARVVVGRRPRLSRGSGPRLTLVARDSPEVDLVERGRTITAPVSEGDALRGISSPVGVCAVPGGGTFLSAFLGGAVTGSEAVARGSGVARESAATQSAAFAP